MDAMANRCLAKTRELFCRPQSSVTLWKWPPFQQAPRLPESELKWQINDSKVRRCGFQTYKGVSISVADSVLLIL